jgi:hypothetical protein
MMKAAERLSGCLAGGVVGVTARSVAPDLIIPGPYLDGQLTDSSLCPDIHPTDPFLLTVIEILKEK